MTKPNPLIWVQAKPDRIARVSPRGEFIPATHAIAVEKTAYITRLIDVHGDIFLAQDPTAKPAKPAPKAAQPEAIMQIEYPPE